MRESQHQLGDVPIDGGHRRTSKAKHQSNVADNLCIGREIKGMLRLR